MTIHHPSCRLQNYFKFLLKPHQIERWLLFFFGTSFLNSSILSLEITSCSRRKSVCGFCQIVQRMPLLKCKDLRCLCPSPAFTIETPSSVLVPAQRRGWELGPRGSTGQALQSVLDRHYRLAFLTCVWKGSNPPKSQGKWVQSSW